MQPSPPAELFVEIRRLHGHYCPMSTLGGRLGFAALRRLSSTEGVRGDYFAATCAVDGIRVATASALDDGSLQLCDRGLHALWLRTKGGASIYAALRPETLTLAGGYREVDQTLERDRPTLSAPELEGRIRAREEFLDHLLIRLRQLPDDELMTFDRCPPEALLSEKAPA